MEIGQRKILFWKKVNKTDGCWLWTGARDEFGHGRFRMDDGRMHLTHRVSWLFENGDIPNDLCCLHKCDIPNCVNPAHLFLGTHADNVADKCSKGRQSRTGSQGVKHPHSKLNDEKVRSIRAMRASGMTQQSIADVYGITQANVSDIVLGKRWTHVRSL